MLAIQDAVDAHLAVENMFALYGVQAVADNPEYHMATMFPFNYPLLIRQHRLRNGKPVTFLYKAPSGLMLPISCRHQMVSGTTDEKLIHEVDMLAASGHNGFWLVLSGGKFRKTMTNRVDRKIRALQGVKGRILINHEAMLKPAIEALVERGDV
jgi:hypothetical protein